MNTVLEIAQNMVTETKILLKAIENILIATLMGCITLILSVTAGMAIAYLGSPAFRLEVAAEIATWASATDLPSFLMLNLPPKEVFAGSVIGSYLIGLWITRP
jgi:UDP-N-acetylmuramyl pentapeptide phosphotransferase/UDP-N-acetylglucosamine-1-phosphate transferase